MIKAILIIAVLAVVCRSHDAIECFIESLSLGGPGQNLLKRSDLDLLSQLDLDHVLTSVKVCTDRQVTFIKGIQASYGKFNSEGETVDSISLNSYGDVNYATAVCTIFYIKQEELLANMIIRYNDVGVTQVWLTTNAGKTASYGTTGTNTENIQV